MLKGFRGLLCKIIEKHEVMEVLTFKAGTTKQVGTSRSELYVEIIQNAKVVDILFGVDHLRESDAYAAKVEEFLPYCEGLSGLKEQVVPEPYWSEECNYKQDYNAKNKNIIAKAKNHNASITSAKAFVKLLKKYT
jgi:hypothetical protein